MDNHTHIATHGTGVLDWWNGRKLENEQGYSTDLLTKYATDFIARNKEAPFFLYLAHGAVHTPLQGRTPSKKQSPVETYQEVIGVLDESVGAVIAELRKHQLEANTLVIFCSDNGPIGVGATANALLKGAKGSLFEGGHRVPFLKDPSKQIDRVLHWLFGGNLAVRKDPWKLIGESDRPVSLVNLASDIGEKTNLIQEQPELVNELMKLHRLWVAEVGNQ